MPANKLSKIFSCAALLGCHMDLRGNRGNSRRVTLRHDLSATSFKMRPQCDHDYQPEADQ
jgi:hypothetical protein